MKPGKALVQSVLNLKKTFNCRTFYIEHAVVIVALVATALISGKSTIERVWVLAVFFTFCYTSITDRLEEREHHRQKNNPSIDPKEIVECYHKLPRFYYAKEICRTIYFVYLGAWSALVWVWIFLLYWPRRKLYRKYHPIW